MRATSVTVRQPRPSSARYQLVLHAGAGGRVEEVSEEAQDAYAEGLRRAYEEGYAVLRGGGSALDAVCATVTVLEDNPLFNAGRGAALTATGAAELDASIMAGDGRAGAVAVSRYARNPVLAARKVMEVTEHVMLVAPTRGVVAGWGLTVEEPEYFVTRPRQEQLQHVQHAQLASSRHGTVGAAALDCFGHLAAATSTGGMVNQRDGRVGDTPVIGAGTFARDGVAAVSCTGHGEAFIEGVVAHEVVARVRHGGASLIDAVSGTIQAELDARDAAGGLIALGADGRVVVAHNSPAMFAAYLDDERLVTMT